MTVFKQEDAERARLLLTGDLTLENIRQLHGELQDALEKTQTLAVDVAGATAADLSFLQLLCAAHRKAMKTGRKLQLEGDLPEVFRQAMEDNGFSGESFESGD